MDHDKKRVIVDGLGAGMTMGEAAQLAGISRSTLKRWVATDDAFAEEVSDARERVDDQVEAVTFRNCLDPDPAHNTLRIFWLKNRRREVYGEKARESDGPQEIVIRYERRDSPARAAHEPDEDP